MYLKNSYHNNRSGCNPKPMPSNLSSDEAISLFEDILNSGLSVRVKATGRSMAPFLEGGEILTIKKVPFGSLRIGDLIFFKTAEGVPLVHRFVSKQCKKDMFLFQTKGDALLSMDNPVTERDILGKVFGVERIFACGKAKHIDMGCSLWRSINYLFAVISLYKSKFYFAVQRSGLYSSFRSLMK
jgi:signal peptidase I